MSFTDFGGIQSDNDASDDGAAAGPQPVPDSSGLPGYPLNGQPDWRVGVPGQSGGLLGLVKVSDLRPAPVAVDSSSTKPGSTDSYETDSWRWNDPDAIAYDLDRKQRQLAEAQGISNALDFHTGGQIAASALSKALRGAVMAEGLGLSAGTFVLGQAMNRAEIPRLQAEVQTLKDRQNLLRQRPGP
jgi:hypothetical protein